MIKRSSGESYAIDAREVAPLAATTDMFYNGSSSSKGEFNLMQKFIRKKLIFLICLLKTLIVGTC